MGSEMVSSYYFDFLRRKRQCKRWKASPFGYYYIYTLGCFLYFKKINFLPSASSFLFLLTIHTSPGRKRSSQNDNCDWGGTNMYYFPQEFTLPFLKMVKFNEFAFIIWNLYSNSQSNCYGIRYFMFWPKKNWVVAN